MERKKITEEQELAKLLSPLQDTLAEHTNISFDNIKVQLTNRINYLLLNDIQQLLNALYRVDVPEEKFNMVMAGSDLENLAADLADLVISRQLQKIESRKRYPQ